MADTKLLRHMIYFCLDGGPPDEQGQRLPKIERRRAGLGAKRRRSARASLVDRLWRQAVVSSLKRRGGDQRRALIPLYRHPDLHVRLKAAKATLAIAPEAARATLEAVRAENVPVDSLEAGMSLRNLDLGIYKPT